MGHTGSLEAEYTFKHAVVQDGAYSTLLRGRRQQIHALIVAASERQFPEIGSTKPQIVAQHAAEAGLNEKAVGYCLKAGQQALARSGYDRGRRPVAEGPSYIGSEAIC